jgi:hypothetical protein
VLQVAACVFGVKTEKKRTRNRTDNKEKNAFFIIKPYIINVNDYKGKVNGMVQRREIANCPKCYAT